VDARCSSAVFIAVEPCLKRLRGEVRFEQLLTRMGLPTASAPHTASR
jgi:hypothetical protein